MARGEGAPGRVAEALTGAIQPVARRKEPCMQSLIERVNNLYREINRRLGGRLAIPARALRRYGENYAYESVSSISYYAIFSVFPLLVFIVTAASFLLDAEVVQEFVVTYLSEVVPVSPEVLVQEISRLLGSSSTINLVALIGFLWSASGVFNTMGLSINRAWNVYNTRSWVISRLLGILVVAGLTGLVILSVILAAVLNILSTLFPQLSWLSSLVWISLVLRFLFLWGIYRYAPDAPVPGQAAFVAALLAALAMEVASRAVSWLTTAGWMNYEVLYGSLGTAIALLSWVYLTDYIFILGAYLSEALANWRQEPEELSLL
jgi:membrane protein